MSVYKALVFVLLILAIQLALLHMVVGITWPQLGAALGVGMGVRFVMDAALPRHCKECGSTKITIAPPQ